MYKLIFIKLLLFSCMLSAIEKTNDKQSNLHNISTTITSSGLEIISSEAFDKFSVRISNATGFSKSFESDSPYISISELDLPENGDYIYEIKAIKVLGFSKKQTHSLNNGRDSGALPLKTKVSIISGKLTNNWGSLVERKAPGQPRNTFGHKGDDIEY